MAGIDDSQTGPRRSRWGVRLLLWFVVVLAIPCAVLLILTVYLNFAAKLPRSMRSEPAAIAAIRNRPAQATPLPRFEATVKRSDAKTSEALAAMKKPFWDRSFYDMFGGFGGGYGPFRELSDKQTAWLKANQPFIESVKSLIAERTGNPVYVREMILEADRNTWGSEPAGFYYVSCVCAMLTADAQHQLDEANYEKAHASFLSILGLIDFCVRDNRRSREALIDRLMSFCVPLTNAIQTKNWPNEQWAGIPEALERIDVLVFDADALEKELADEYVEERARLIHELDGPWTSPVFGWQLRNRSLYFTTDLYWMNGQSVWVPRPVRFLGSMAAAMSMKRRSAEILKKNDEARLAFIKTFRMPYADRKASPEWMMYERYRNEPIIFRGPVKAAVGFTPSETALHLDRLALLWRLDRPRAEALRARPLQPHNPWRDPFSDKTLMLDETTTGTLLYSSGPALDPEKSRHISGCNVFVQK